MQTIRAERAGVAGGQYAGLVVLGLGLGLPGCAKITASTTYTETLISRKTSTKVVPESLRYTVVPTLEAQVLNVAIRREETCRTRVTPIYRKEAHITRTAAPGQMMSPTATVSYGLIAGATGAYMYLGAETHAVSPGSEDSLTADEYRASGIALGVFGLAALGVALVDGLRLVDEDKLVGDVRGEPEVSEESCHEQVAANAEVRATVGRLPFQLRTATDARGAVRLELHDLPEDAFSQPELGMTLEVDGTRVPLVLSAATTRRLLATLEADPTTTVRRERDARARASCAEQVAAASAVTIDVATAPAVIERLEAAWRKARNVCGEAWAPAHEEALAVFGAQVTATAAERETRACTDAGATASQLLAQRSEAEDELAIDELQEELGERCAHASNAEVVQATFARSVTAAEQARTLAAERTGRIEDLSTRLHRNDALGVRVILGKDRPLAQRLRALDEFPSWITRMATHWIHKYERGDQGAPVRRQLCAARALTLSYVGRDAWARLRAAAVQRADVASGARLAKVLDGGGCS